MKHSESHKFFAAYANLPIPLRREIVAVIDDEPITWHIVHLEVENETELGYKAVDQMVRLKII